MDLESACREGDRLACDAWEFEGPNPKGSSDLGNRRGLGWQLHRGGGGGSGGTWQPSTSELVFALVPLLILALATRLWTRGQRRGMPAAGAQASPASLRSRRLAALAGPPRHTGGTSLSGLSGQPRSEPRQRVTVQPVGPAPPTSEDPAPALPPHPTAAAVEAAGAGPPGGRSTTLSPRLRAAGSGLLTAADTALSGLLVLPFSLLQHARSLRADRGGAGAVGAAGTAGPAAAGPYTPDVALASPPSQRAGGSGGGRVYGLGIGEAESEEDEWGAEESELTQACLRRLQQSAEFKAYLKTRGLTSAHVGATARRLRLYRRLRRLDPAAFWQLLRPSSRRVFDSQPPSRLALAAEYLLSTAIALAVAAAAYKLCGAAKLAAVPPGWKAAAAAVLAWPVVAQWLTARPTAGKLFGMWYEEERWSHAAPAWRCVAAALLELAYLATSAGLGLPISFCLRCLSARRQSVGEMLLAIHPVKEVELPARLGGQDDEEED